MKIQYLILALFLVLAVFVGCKDDDNPVNPPGGGSTTFVGTMAGATESAAMTLDIPTAKSSAAAGDTVNVSGKIYLSSGDTVLLVGIYVKTTGYLEVSGGGYTITGTITDGRLTATYIGPNGPGSCVAASSSSGGTIKVYCGHSNQDPPGENTSVFNMVVDGASITVVSESFTFYGTLSGTSVTIYLSGTSGPVLATGTLSGDAVSDGRYTTPEAETGSWVASLCH